MDRTDCALTTFRSRLVLFKVADRNWYGTYMIYPNFPISENTTVQWDGTHNTHHSLYRRIHAYNHWTSQKRNKKKTSDRIHNNISSVQCKRDNPSPKLFYKTRKTSQMPQRHTKCKYTLFTYIFWGQHYLLHAGWKERKQERYDMNRTKSLTQTHIHDANCHQFNTNCDSPSLKKRRNSNDDDDRDRVPRERHQLKMKRANHDDHMLQMERIILSFCFVFPYTSVYSSCWICMAPDGTSRIHWLSYIQIAAKYGINYMTVISPIQRHQVYSALVHKHHEKKILYYYGTRNTNHSAVNIICINEFSKLSWQVLRDKQRLSASEMKWEKVPLHTTLISIYMRSEYLLLLLLLLFPLFSQVWVINTNNGFCERAIKMKFFSKFGNWKPPKYKILDCIQIWNSISILTFISKGAKCFETKF